MVQMNTSNLIEFWHNELELVSLKYAGMQQTDILVYNLLKGSLVDLRPKVANAVNGLGRRRMCQAEASQLNEYNAVALYNAVHYIRRPILNGANEELEKAIPSQIVHECGC